LYEQVGVYFPLDTLEDESLQTNTTYLGSPGISTLSRTLIRSAVFAQRSCMTDTDKPCYSITGCNAATGATYNKKMASGHETILPLLQPPPPPYTQFIDNKLISVVITGQARSLKIPETMIHRKL